MIIEQKETIRKFVSDSNSAEIIFPIVGTSVLVKAFPHGIFEGRGIDLTLKKEEREQTEAHFAEVVRNLINAKLRTKAARQFSDSVVEEPEMSADALNFEFGKAVESLRKMGDTEEKLKKTIREQSGLFNSGEKHMGEIPAVVREEREALNMELHEYYGTDKSK
jgi:hypothetical protein